MRNQTATARPAQARSARRQSGSAAGAKTPEAPAAPAAPEAHKAQEAQKARKAVKPAAKPPARKAAPVEAAAPALDLSPGPALLEGPARDELVRIRAYDRYERNGRLQGHDVDDWLAAEAEVCAITSQGASGAAARRG